MVIEIVARNKRTHTHIQVSFYIMLVYISWARLVTRLWFHVIFFCHKEVGTNYDQLNNPFMLDQRLRRGCIGARVAAIHILRCKTEPFLYMCATHWHCGGITIKHYIVRLLFLEINGNSLFEWFWDPTTLGKRLVDCLWKLHDFICL